MKAGRRQTPMLVLAVAAALLAHGPAMGGNLEAKPSAIQHLAIDEDTNDEIAKVDKHLEKKEWRKAIEICQGLLAKPPKVMVKIRDGVYGGPHAVCEAKLRRMPAPAQLLYRTLYDAEAERLLKQALTNRGLPDVRRVVREFGCTSHGPRARAVLADLLFERGDARGALDQWLLWKGTADMKAVPEAVRRRTAVKIATAAARLGDRPALESAVELFGEKGTLIEAGPKRLARAAELRTFAAGLWLDGGRDLPAMPPQLDFKRWLQVGDQTYTRRATRYYGSSESLAFGASGAVSGGVCFQNIPAGVRARDTLTGQTLWKRAARNYSGDYYYTPRSSNLYSRVWPAAWDAKERILFVSGGVRLGAYNVKSGRLLWSKTRSSFGAIEAIGNDEELRINISSPVICWRDKAYAVVETSQGQVFLMAFRQRTGALVWHIALGGSSRGSGRRASFPSALARAGSQILVVTGHGVLASCDGSTGELRWLVPYRRHKRFAKERRYYDVVSLRYHPLLPAGDSVICMPADGQQIMSVRVSDGHVNWEKEVPADRRLAAVLPAAPGRPGRVFVSGSVVKSLSDEDGEVLWSWPVPESGKAGLGLLTDVGLTFATRKGIYTLSPETGELARFDPVLLPDWEDIHVASGPDAVVLTAGSGICSIGGRKRTEELLLKPSAKGAEPWVVAMRARLRRDQGRVESALKLYGRAIEAARRRSDTAKLAAILESELLDLYHSRQQAEWKAGRPIEAFLWLRRALAAPSRLPYECSIAYGAGEAEQPAGPHKVVLASGDRVSGTLQSIGPDHVVLLVGGEPWQIQAAGVTRVVVSAGGVGEDEAGPRGPHLALTNGDRITCSIEALRDGELLARAPFGTFRAKLDSVAEIVLGGTAPKRPRDAVHVTLQNGDRLSGRILAFDGTAFLLELPSCGARRIELSAIRAVANRRARSGRKGPRRRLDIPPPGEKESK